MCSDCTATTNKYDMNFNILSQKQSMHASTLLIICKILELCETKFGRIECQSTRRYIVDIHTMKL